MGALISQALRQNVAKSATPASPAPARSESLAGTYENMARDLLQAAAQLHPVLVRQPRANVEQMLRAMMTQAAYETGRFKSDLAEQACNYWGMKDRADVKADRILYKGEYYERFTSMNEGCRGYIQALKRSHYAGLENHTATVHDYLAYISSSGWCPKATYADEALAVYRHDQDDIDRAARQAIDGLIVASAR